MKKVIAIGVSLLVLLAPASALAKKHKKPKKLGPVVTATATGNTVSTQGKISTATATCPSGKQAVGGGFSVPLDSTNALFVISSFRSAPNAWTIAARLQDGSGAATAFAYCRNAGRAISDVSGTGTVPSGTAQAGSASASCPAGTQLISGGFQIDTGADPSEYALPVVNLAVNTSPSWLVQAVNNLGGARTITAHAYCMAKIAAPRFVDATSSPTLARNAGASLASPPCPKSKGKKKGKKKKPAKLLSAGGFASQAVVPIEIFSDSRIDSGTWLNSGVNVTGPTGAIHLSSQGICL